MVHAVLILMCCSDAVRALRIFFAFFAFGYDEDFPPIYLDLSFAGGDFVVMEFSDYLVWHVMFIYQVRVISKDSAAFARLMFIYFCFVVFFFQVGYFVFVLAVYLCHFVGCFVPVGDFRCAL